MKSNTQPAEFPKEILQVLCIDGITDELQNFIFVIPAQAGIQTKIKQNLDSRLRGNDRVARFIIWGI